MQIFDDNTVKLLQEELADADTPSARKDDISKYIKLRDKFIRNQNTFAELLEMNAVQKRIVAYSSDTEALNKELMQKLSRTRIGKGASDLFWNSNIVLKTIHDNLDFLTAGKDLITESLYNQYKKGRPYKGQGNTADKLDRDKKDTTDPERSKPGTSIIPTSSSSAETIYYVKCETTPIEGGTNNIIADKVLIMNGASNILGSRVAMMTGSGMGGASMMGQALLPSMNGTEEASSGTLWLNKDQYSVKNNDKSPAKQLLEISKSSNAFLKVIEAKQKAISTGILLVGAAILGIVAYFKNEKFRAFMNKVFDATIRSDKFKTFMTDIVKSAVVSALSVGLDTSFDNYTNLWEKRSQGSQLTAHGSLTEITKYLRERGTTKLSGESGLTEKTTQNGVTTYSTHFEGTPGTTMVKDAKGNEREVPQDLVILAPFDGMLLQIIKESDGTITMECTKSTNIAERAVTGGASMTPGLSWVARAVDPNRFFVKGVREPLVATMEPFKKGQPIAIASGTSFDISTARDDDLSVKDYMNLMNTADAKKVAESFARSKTGKDGVTENNSFKRLQKESGKAADATLTEQLLHNLAQTQANAVETVKGSPGIGPDIITPTSSTNNTTPNVGQVNDLGIDSADRLQASATGIEGK